MRARGLLPILLLNVIVSVIVAFGIIAVFNNRDESAPEVVTTLPFLIVTATPDPNITPVYIVVTATPGGEEATVGVTIPADALAGAGITPGATSVLNAPTEAANPEGVSTVSTDDSNSDLPAGCIYHTIEDGDIISALGPEYGVSYFDIMAVNNFTEEDAVGLNIGDVILIPLEGCPMEQFVSATVVEVVATDEAAEDSPEAEGDEATSAPDATIEGTPSVRPTMTLPPTATNSMMEIQQVTAAGDITRESVSIRNNGLVTDISAWTLSDLDGNTYTFRDDLIFFSQGIITVNTRAGTDTPITYYQGKDQALFSAGDVLTLTDADGEVQATYRVP